MTPDPTDRERVLEKVRKLFARASDLTGSTQGERDSAMRGARALLAKYNIDVADVEAKTGKIDEKRGIMRASFYGRPWARSVAQSAAVLCFCDYLYIGRSEAKDTIHLFIGRESNGITATQLAEYLVTSINRESKSHQRKNGLRNDSYRAFAWGAADAITQRVAALRAEPEEAPEATPGSSRALVVYEANEHQENQKLITETFNNKLGTGRIGKGISDYLAAQAGHRYGETVSLDRQVSGKGQSRLTNHSGE